jgi:hypothetical protein
LRELRHFLQGCLLQHFGRVPRGRDSAVAP